MPSSQKSNSQKKGRQSNQSRLLNKLRPHIQRACLGNFKKIGVFGCAKRAALAKAFGFAMHVAAKQPEPFFLTATLRGICEDLIVLSFLDPLPDRDEILRAMNSVNISDGMKRQQAFFTANRSWQPVIVPEPNFPEQAASKLKSIALAHGWERNRLPTIQRMAKESGFLPLYDFIYAATSKWVHCTPHLLLRMGWCKQCDRNKLSDETEWEFSTKHFTQYYNEFNSLYSSFLLVLMIRRFLSEFDQRNEVQDIIERLEAANADEMRWPELVTYEEMNLDGPGPLMRMMLRVKADIERNKKSAVRTPRAALS